MDEALPDRLLDYLRGRFGAAVAFAEAPHLLTGGFDTTTMAFRLEGGPADWPDGLILRVMARPDFTERVRREAATHAALVGEGFEAPRLLVAEDDAAPLGRPFIVMERLAGQNMWANAVGPQGRRSYLLRMADDLGAANARLHGVRTEALRESARRFDVDPARFTLAGDVQRLADRIARSGLPGLQPGMTWLLANQPAPAQPEVICHGDFHPLNVMMDGTRCTGVIDWSQAVVAEPAFDIAGTRMLALYGNTGLRPPLRWLADVARRWMAGRYLAAYRARRPIDLRNFPYFEALRIMGALVFASETPPSPNNPWNAPHTLATLYRRFERDTGVKVQIS
jgi:aminoglycoside phosphotransferase (APT) family kinase protein